MNPSPSAESSPNILWPVVLVLVQSAPASLPQGTLALHYGQWTMSVKLFRFVEEQVMYRQKPTQGDVAFHKIAVTALISTGELLRRQMLEIPPAHLAEAGLSLETAEINVRALDDSYAEWHLPLAKERESELKKVIFAPGDNPPSCRD